MFFLHRAACKIITLLMKCNSNLLKLRTRFSIFLSPDYLYLRKILCYKFRQPLARRAAYCIAHGPRPPPPQLFVFKMATNQLVLLHTSDSHHIPLGNCFGDILIPISSIIQLLRPLTSKCLIAHFRKQFLSDLLLI